MIIGLNGKAQSGKDTVYQIIRELLPQAKRLAFADPLKHSVCALFGISSVELEEWKTDTKVHVQFWKHIPGSTNPMLLNVPLTVRELLQRYGTEAHREIFGPDFWLDPTLPGTAADYESKIYIVTDARFNNEAARIRALGGKMVLVERPGSHLEVGNGHASEDDLDRSLINYVLCNEGTVEDLRAKVQRMLTEFRLYA